MRLALFPPSQPHKTGTPHRKYPFLILLPSPHALQFNLSPIQNRLKTSQCCDIMCTVQHPICGCVCRARGFVRGRRFSARERSRSSRHPIPAHLLSRAGETGGMIHGEANPRAHRRRGRKAAAGGARQSGDRSANQNGGADLQIEYPDLFQRYLPAPRRRCGCGACFQEENGQRRITKLHKSLKERVTNNKKLCGFATQLFSYVGIYASFPILFLETSTTPAPTTRKPPRT